MKKQFILFIAIIFTLALVGSAYAAAECPQPRKTKSAPSSTGKSDKTKRANKANGKKIYTKTAKPIACNMCHGKKGDGTGKLGKAFKSPVAPRNFTCKETMKNVSPGQMFWIIKNGSKGTGMVAHKKTLKDKQIWDVIKYIRADLMK